MKRLTRKPKLGSIPSLYDNRLNLTERQKAARHARIVGAMPEPNLSRAAKLTRARLMAGR